MPNNFPPFYGDDVELKTSEIAENHHTVSNGGQLIESSLVEDATLISTTKDFYANTITTAQASVKIGPALTISSGGGEMLQKSQITEELEYSILPSKIYNHITGTSDQLTTGKALSEYLQIVLYPDFTLRSDDPTATIPPNNVSGKVTSLFPAIEDRWITEFRYRFATAQTGVRKIARVGSSTGPIVFESESIQSYEAGEGVTTLVYDGTPETETVFDFTDSPWVTYAGQTYHITFESSQGDVVMFGGIIGGEFKPYTDRDVSILLDDPVVAHSVYFKDEDFDMADIPWHSTVVMDTTSGNKTVTLPTAVGLKAQGMFIFVTKSDNTGNSVIVHPFSGQTIDGVTEIVIEFPNKSAVFFSNGLNVSLLNLNTNEFTDDEKAKLASITGGRFLGVFATETDLSTAYPTGVEGDSALVNSTATTWYWDGAAWVDSLVGSSGDMLKATYDPTAKNASAFSMANMDETASYKVMTTAERSAIAANTAKVSNVTHTGEVTGDTNLSLDKTSITNKSVTLAVDSDYLLISDTSDTGNLKKAPVSDLLIDARHDIIIINNVSDMPTPVLVDGVLSIVPENKQYLINTLISSPYPIAWPGAGNRATFTSVNRAVWSYTGTDACFRDLGAEGDIELQGLTWFEAPNGNMWEVDNTVGTYTWGFQASDTPRFTNTNSLGTVSNSGGFNLHFASITNFDQGLVFENTAFFEMNLVFVFGNNQPGCVHFTGQGANCVGSVNFIAPTVSIGSNETVFDMKPEIQAGIDSLNFRGCQEEGGLNGLVFAPGSLNSKSLKIVSTGNSFIPDSKSIGSAYIKNNVTTTDPATSLQWYDINFGVGGVSAGTNIERFTLTNAQTGELRYDGLREFTGVIISTFTSVSVGGDRGFNFRYVRNGLVLPDDIITAVQIGATVGSATLVVPVTLQTGDLIKPQVTRVDGTSTITVRHFSNNVS